MFGLTMRWFPCWWHRSVSHSRGVLGRAGLGVGSAFWDGFLNVVALDRLKIVYDFSQQSLMISPANKPGFLSAIVQQCPPLVVLHDRVRKMTHSHYATVGPTIQQRVLV